MDVLIEVNGRIYSLPLTGEILDISIRSKNIAIRCAGFPSGRKGLSSKELARIRSDRVFSVIPHAPAYVTVSDIVSVLPDLSHDTVERALRGFLENGDVTYIKPKEQRRGNVARRWMRRK